MAFSALLINGQEVPYHHLEINCLAFNVAEYRPIDLLELSIIMSTSIRMINVLETQNVDHVLMKFQTYYYRWSHYKIDKISWRQFVSPLMQAKLDWRKCGF